MGRTGSACQGQAYFSWSVTSRSTTPRTTTSQQMATICSLCLVTSWTPAALSLGAFFSVAAHQCFHLGPWPILPKLCSCEFPLNPAHPNTCLTHTELMHPSQGKSDFRLIVLMTCVSLPLHPDVTFSYRSPTSFQFTTFQKLLRYSGFLFWYSATARHHLALNIGVMGKAT